MTITPIKRGRPAKLEMPPIPQAVLDGMDETERAHFEHFVASYSQAYKDTHGGKLTPTAEINIVQAGLDYVHLWRLQAKQMTEHDIVSQARQHPGVQVRAWLASAGLQEKDMEAPKKPEDKNRAQLLSLSS